MAKTAAERKREQRARDKSKGWTYVQVRIPHGKETELNAFVKSLGEPDDKPLKGQLSMFD